MYPVYVTISLLGWLPTSTGKIIQVLPASLATDSVWMGSNIFKHLQTSSSKPYEYHMNTICASDDHPQPPSCFHWRSAGALRRCPPFGKLPGHGRHRIQWLWPSNLVQNWVRNLNVDGWWVTRCHWMSLDAPQISMEPMAFYELPQGPSWWQDQFNNLKRLWTAAMWPSNGKTSPSTVYSPLRTHISNV